MKFFQTFNVMSETVVSEHIKNPWILNEIGDLNK